MASVERTEKAATMDDKGFDALAAQIAHLTDRLETKLDKAVGDRLATIQDTLCEIKAHITRAAKQPDASDPASTQQTLGELKAHITHTAEKSGANDGASSHEKPGANDTASTQPTPAPSVKQPNSSTATTMLPTDDGGRAFKRKRENDNDVVAPSKTAKLSDEQKQELGKNLQLYSLVQAALERIIPCEGLQDWNRGEVLSVFNPQFMDDILKVARVISFMDQCSTTNWHCVRSIVDGKASAVTINHRCVSCYSQCVQFSRLETDGGLGSRYYLGRVERRRFGWSVARRGDT